MLLFKPPKAPPLRLLWALLGKFHADAPGYLPGVISLPFPSFSFLSSHGDTQSYTDYTATALASFHMQGVLGQALAATKIIGWKMNVLAEGLSNNGEKHEFYSSQAALADAHNLDGH